MQGQCIQGGFIPRANIVFTGNLLQPIHTGLVVYITNPDNFCTITIYRALFTNKPQTLYFTIANFTVDNQLGA